MARRTTVISLIVLLAPLLAACPWMRSPETPMPAVDHQAHGPEKARGLVVFLPGFGDGPDHFTDNGFVNQVRKLDAKWDAIATDAHFGYYRKFTILERLREDVIKPAREKGYKEIWLVGISMGGFGVLSYAQRYPQDITGVIAMAAYMGDGDVVDQVIEAGGLKKWTPPADLAAIEDKEEQHSYRMWTWFKSFEKGLAGKPHVYLAWGNDDRLRTPNKQLAALLPKDRVFTRDGGHKWTTWRPLFATVAPAVLGKPAPSTAPATSPTTSATPAATVPGS